MITPPAATRLQEASVDLRCALFRAREVMEPVEYYALLDFATYLIAAECARCARWGRDENDGGEAA